MEKLILERSPAEQGKPVKVSVSGSRGHCGEFIVTFDEWIHLRKLINEGTESQKRKNEQKIEVVIRGVGDKSKPKEQKEAEKAEVRPKPSTIELDAEVNAIMVGIATPVEAEKAVELVNSFTETNGLVRSLIREGDKE